jgi:8-oxo-dGTP diphosphatase
MKTKATSPRRPPVKSAGRKSTTREYPDRPIVGVGAVIVDQGRVLLVKRGSPPLLGEWSLPGGEAREETGLLVKAGEVLEVLDRIVPDKDGAPQYHYVLIDFLCAVKGGKLHAGSDAGDVCWVRENELGKFKLEQPAIGVIRKAFLAANQRE